MGAVYQQVLLYKKQGTLSGNDAWSTSSNTISNVAIDVEIKKGVMNVKDTFSFRLARPQTYYTSATPTVEYGDLVRIYFTRDTTTFTVSDLLIEGVVTTVPLDEGPDNKFITVKGNDFFEMMFSVQIPISGLEGSQKTCMEILRGAMDRYEFSSRNLYWDSTNPTTKANGDSFPIIDLALNYTPFYQIVEKLTSNENTGDGQYVYYVTTDGTRRYLTIRNRQEATTLGSFTEGTLTESIKLEKNKDDVKNFVIYNAGNDLAGNPAEFFVADYASIGKVGFQEYYMIEETADVTDYVMQEEARQAGTTYFAWANGKWDATSSGTVGQYPKAFPYTWQRWQISGTYATATDDEEFDDQLRTIGMNQASIIARNFIERTKTPKYRTEMSFRFRNDFTLGGLYDVVVPTRNINRKLRITEATHTLRGTTITFEEDEHRAEL